jgi:predicted DNA-binding protein with PD1-like motif
MKSRLLHEAHGLRTFVAVLEIGDEVTSTLQRLAETERLSAAQVTAIGALEKAILTYWDWDTKEYQEIPVNEQVEVLSLNGDVTLDASGKPKLHLHTVLGRRDGAAMGGHLKEAHVRPTLEAIITETPAHLRRREDPETGLALIVIEG